MNPENPFIKYKLEDTVCEVFSLTVVLLISQHCYLLICRNTVNSEIQKKLLSPRSSLLKFEIVILYENLKV